MVDSKGVIHTERTDLNESKRAFARDTKRRTLKEALEGADLFLGLSRGGLVDEEMVRSMAENPIIFALANPDPEIDYDVAKRARPDAIVATGRSDYNNQVNNVLGFPGIFRGALDVRARLINEEMKVAAARALAELAQRDVPLDVNRDYGADYTFGPDYIIPNPFDPREDQWVSPEVAEAAVETGVARIEIDLKDYRERMRTLLGGATALMRRFVRRAQRDPRRIVFIEGEHPQILEACAILADEGIAKPVLLGRPDVISATLAEHEIDLAPGDFEVVYPREDARLGTYVKQYHGARARKGVDLTQATQRMSESVYFGLAMVKNGDADGVIGGLDHSIEIIRQRWRPWGW